MMPYEVPVTQPGSAVHQKMSSGCKSSAKRPVMWCATTASMHVHRALGRAGGAAGEVQQRQVFGIGRRDFEVVARFVHQLMEVESVRESLESPRACRSAARARPGSDARSSATLRL